MHGRILEPALRQVEPLRVLVCGPSGPLLTGLRETIVGEIGASSVLSRKLCVTSWILPGARADLERVTHHARFGRAVAVVRKEHGLKQADIPAVSARQVRRIEAGSLPRSETLHRLARAHGLELGEYLAHIAATAERLARPVRDRHQNPPSAG